jgi:hypothetical protein
MSISRQQRTAIEHHGLHLVPNLTRNAEPPHAGFLYRIAAVAAALFLAMTVC